MTEQHPVRDLVDKVDEIFKSVLATEDKLVNAVHFWKERAERLEERLTMLEVAARRLIAYRQRNNPLTVQLEKLDDYIRDLEMALGRSPE